MITEKSGLVPQTLSTERDRSQKRIDLQTSAEKYMSAIQEQVGDLKETGKTALIIGGIILAGYFVTEMLLPEVSEQAEDDASNKRTAQEDDSILFAMLKGVATTVLLTLAREKLMKLIDGLPENESTIVTK